MSKGELGMRAFFIPFGNKIGVVGGQSVGILYNLGSTTFEIVILETRVLTRALISYERLCFIRVESPLATCTR
jgi:hypothetical protein